MNLNNFWGPARSSGVKMGMIVRLGLALLVMVGSLTLAWVLLSTHYQAHASSVNTIQLADNLWGIVFDGSGNAWVAEPNCNPAPTCLNPPNGEIQEFNLQGGQPTLLNSYVAPATGKFNPTFLQLDGNGHVWFTDPTNNAIGELTTSGNHWQEFTAGISTNEQPFGLVRDKNGNLWFAERAATPASGTQGVSKIGFFNTGTDAVVETAVPTANSQPFDLTYDATNNVVWFSEDNAPKIGKFTPSTNGTVSIAEFSVAAGPTPFDPHMITYDGNGHLWYSGGFSTLIGEYTVATNTAQAFSLAGGICPTPGVTPTTCTVKFISGIALDSHGLVWFDEALSAVLGSYNPTTGAINLFALQSGSGPGEGLGVDANNNVWVSMLYSKQLGELPSGTASTPTPSPTGSPTITPTATPPPLQTGPVNKQWYFAEGRAGAGFKEWLSLDNPTGNACQVNITYLYTPDRGVSQTRTVPVTINPSQRLSEYVDNDLGTSPTGIGISDSAILTVDNNVTPNCTGIVAERPMYFNAVNTTSGSDVLGLTKLGTSFYFADMAVGNQPGGGSYASFLPILNPPNGQTANVTATYYSGGVQVGQQTLAVLSGTRGTILPGQASPALPAHVAVVVTSDQPVAVERPTYFSKINGGNAGTVTGAADVVGVQTLANDWLFAEGYTGGKFQENFVIANLDKTANATANVTIKLEYPNGATQSITATVPTLTQTVFNVNTNTNQPGQSVSAEISSTGAKIVVEREMFFYYNHQNPSDGRHLTAVGGTDVIGQVGPAAATIYSFAEGYTQVGFDEWLTLQNPTTNTETIWVTLFNQQGKVYTFSVSVLANSRATVDIVATMLKNMCPSGSPTPCFEVSMTVQTVNNGGAFVAERPMYFNAAGQQGGTDTIGYTGG